MFTTIFVFDLAMINQIKRSALIAYSPDHMFDLVNDVERYPEFLDGCVSTRLLEKTEHHVIAKMHLKKAGIEIGFTTKNTIIRPSKIIITLVDGPFKSFEGEWIFKEIGTDNCKLSLDLSFQLNNSMARFAASKLMTLVANDLVRVICYRAEKLYGDSSRPSC